MIIAVLSLDMDGYHWLCMVTDGHWMLSMVICDPLYEKGPIGINYQIAVEALKGRTMIFYQICFFIIIWKCSLFSTLCYAWFVIKTFGSKVNNQKKLCGQLPGSIYGRSIIQFPAKLIKRLAPAVTYTRQIQRLL